MKQNTNKMLFEKASAMARKMDETYDKNEACAKSAENSCKRAKEYANVAQGEYDNMERLAYRAAIGHAAAIALGALISIIAGIVAAVLTVGMLE